MANRNKRKPAPAATQEPVVEAPTEEATQKEKEAVRDDSTSSDADEDAQEPVVEESLEVIATKSGYYGSKLREVGEDFTLRDKDHFSKNWMKRKEA
ncbi:hypothetical protein [Kiloniella majae]|uniref:hypothetical protein n=1 Tax=Kiloniella majae TaxID=1938558 RepID=UPI000A2784F8|nr:hypothetical protein [Kiloniella majae]